MINQEKDGSVILTFPVMVPGIPDCDFDRGEPPLTVEQIKNFAKSYENYQLVDSEHELEHNERKIGKPLESFILEDDSNLILLDGAEKSYPRGTWMLSTRITDPVAVETALRGGYTGASPTVKNREVADRLYAALKSEQMTYDEFRGACKSHSLDGLIKDVVDPVVLSVSLTGKPCQHHSRFCKHNILGENMSDDTKKIKAKVLEALGMSEEAEVSALKSQVDDLDEKIDGLEEKFESSLKSMQESFENTLKEALKPVASSKAEEGDEEEEEEGEGETKPTPEEKPPEQNEEEEEKEEEEEETEPPKKQKGASKSRPLHNNKEPQSKVEINTYKAMGRNPDGTAKSI